MQKINYIYFGLFFLVLLLFTSSSILTKTSLGGSQIFFLLYALGQVILEVALLISLGLLIERFLGRACFHLFIGLTFIVLFLHFFDFLMDRILDLSVWEALRIFVLDESWSNFIYLLDASGISFWAWGIFFVVLALLPLIGIALYRFSMLIVKKNPLPIGPNHILQAVLCIPAALFFWDYSASKAIHPDAYTAFTTSLPWKHTFLQPQKSALVLNGSLKLPPSEAVVKRAIELDSTNLSRKPNIYLFIVESLREDAITKKIAPHLEKFKGDCIPISHALSSGNGTHLSWFSIFHSQPSLFWKIFQNQKWEMGSSSLTLLKKWGYKIHLYSSAELGYYRMGELIFGKNYHLLDTKQRFQHVPPLSAADTDAQALLALRKDLENPALQEGQLFVIFLDSTHFDYSWPKNWTPKFTPFAQEFAYFRTILSKKTIQELKNRYYNSVNYIDSLFGLFLKDLPHRDEAVILFTGDHGEEFFEHGHLFHNSHLTREQISVPLYAKFGNKQEKGRTLASQMDIFPSLLDFLAGKSFPFFEGNSFFQKEKDQSAITARFNAGNTPYEFALHNGKYKLILQFSNRKNFLESKELKIISLRTHEDRWVEVDGVQSWINQQFGAAIDHLFEAD